MSYPEPDTPWIHPWRLVGGVHAANGPGPGYGTTLISAAADLKAMRSSAELSEAA